MTQQAFTIAQFVAAFGICRTQVYEELQSGRLASYRVGRRHFISATAAANWQRQREEEYQSSKAGAEVPA